MSLAARLLNVFAMPGDVFASVKASKTSVANWLVPALLLAVMGPLTALVILAQPSVQKQLNEALDRQAKLIDQQVQAGKVDRATADKAVAVSRSIYQPPVVQVLFGGAAAAVGLVRVFWWAFLLWLLARRFLRARIGFIKSLEVAGLALMISVLGTIVVLLLTLNVSAISAKPNLGLLVSDLNPSRSNLLFWVLTVFSLWLVFTLSAGLSKLAEVPFLRAAWLVFAAWIIQDSLLVLFGGVFGQLAI